jgi:hypothetical protein
MAFNLTNINGGNILLNKSNITSEGGNLIVIANDPATFANINVSSQSYNVYYYTGENITIYNTGTYNLNDNSVYNTGPTGYTGYQGPIGFQGSVGAGVQGPQGVIGANGIQGFQGARGSDGIIGVDGVQGPQGIVGKGFVIFAHVNSFNDIGSVSVSNSNIGEFVLVKGGDLYVYYGNNAGSTGPNNSYSYAGDITDESKLNGFQGNVGPQGAVGFQGAVGSGFQGSAGSNGVQGFQGAVGSAGSNGAQGFQGAVGSAGSNGAQGFQGAVGSAGSNGVQGFQGAVGSAGSNGVQGFQGAVGSAGSNGAQGFQGAVGSAGSNGVQGFQGDVGSAGSNGVQGFQGAVGSAGSNGVQGFQGDVGITSITGVLNKYIDTEKTVNIINLTGAYGSWVSRVSGTSSDIGNGIAVDSLGESYVTGQYTSPATIYNSDGTAFRTISGSGSNEAFVAKFGSTGMGSWVSRISGTSNDIGRGIVVDSLGNSYVTGQYVSPANIYNSDGTAFRTMSGSGTNEAFIVKFGSTGMGSWVSRVSGTSADIGNGIAVDSLGNSYVTGNYTSPATIYNSDGTAFQTISGSGSIEAFVAKFGSTGMGSWVSRISGTSSDVGYGIAVDSLGNSYVTGQYTSAATIYNSDGTVYQTMSGSGSSDAFVAKFGSTGMGSWVSRISGTSSDVGYGIAVDSLGNSYVTGQYNSPATIYNSDGTAFQTMSGRAGGEAFVVKFGSTGMGSWSSQIVSAILNPADTGYGIAVDSLGNSYVTGQYNSPATIYNSDGTVYQNISGSGSSDAFIVKFGSTGMGSWSSKVSGTAGEVGYGIAVDSLGNSYVTGQYNSPATIYNSDGTVYQTMSGSGSAEAFIVKLNNGPNSISSYYLVDLDNNPSNDGKTVYIANKVYQLGFILNLQTQSLVTYSTINVTTSISLIFFNGTWIVISQS